MDEREDSGAFTYTDAPAHQRTGENCIYSHMAGQAKPREPCTRAHTHTHWATSIHFSHHTRSCHTSSATQADLDLDPDPGMRGLQVSCAML